MMTRRKLFLGLLAAPLVALVAPVVKLVKMIPIPAWGPWVKHTWGTMRIRMRPDDNALDIEVRLRPAITNISVELIVGDSPLTPALRHQVVADQDQDGRIAIHDTM